MKLICVCPSIQTNTEFIKLQPTIFRSVIYKYEKIIFHNSDSVWSDECQITG